MPKSNPAFWLSKLSGNRLRDRRNALRLRRLGWRVLTIWECNLGEPGLTQLYRKIKAAR